MIKTVTKRKAGSFAKHVGTLAGGTTAAYAVTVLSAPITSRLFDPHAFGVATLFTSAALVLGMVSTLRYEMAMVLPREEKDAVALFGVCSIVLLIMVLAIFFSVLLFGSRLLSLANATELQPYLLFFPAYVFFFGLERLVQFWNTRNKRFDLVVAGRMLTTFPTAMAEIGGGLAGLTSAGNLVFLRTIAMIVAPFCLLWKLFSTELSTFAGMFHPGGLWRVSRRYKKFPLYDSWATFLNSISWNIPLLLMPAFFGPSVAGLFAKALYLLYLPVLLIGQSVGQVLLQSAAENLNDAAVLKALIRKLFQRMITIAILPLALVTLIGPEIFSVFLGQRWAPSGKFAVIMCPWLFMLLLFSSIRTLYQVLERQGIGLALNLVLFGLILAALVLGGTVLEDPYWTVLLMTIISTLIFLFQCHYLLTAVGLNLGVPAVHFFRMTIFALPTLVVTACAKWIFELDPFFLLLVGSASSIFYGFFVIRHDSEMRGLICRFFPKTKIHAGR